MSNAVNIIFEHEDKVLPGDFDFGVFEGEDESDWKEFVIKHSSNYPIKSSSFFIEPIEDFYRGSVTGEFDYNTMIWIADNYPGYGLSIFQEYEVFGTIYRQDSNRLLDTGRKEATDIFTGQTIEILSGPSAGEQRVVQGYDPDNGLFFLNSDFSTDVVGLTYKILIQQTHFFKTRQGSSVDYPIDLLYNAGIIERFETATFALKLKIPPFFKKSSIGNLSLGLKFTPEE